MSRTRRRAALVLLAGIALLPASATAADATSRPAAAVGTVVPAAVVAAPAAPAAPAVLAAAAAAPAAPAAPDPAGPSAPKGPAAAKAKAGADSTVSLSVPGQPSQIVQIILLVTVLGVAPAVLLLCTAFTKIVVVLSLVRSAIGTQSVPPNQVLVGLALFLSLFVMGPTFDAMQSQGVAPYTKGTKTTKPMMNAARSSLSTKAGTRVRSSTSSLLFGAASPDAFVMSAISSARVCASMNFCSGFTPSV